MKNKFDLKKILPYILAIAAFIAIAYSYAPQTLSGKVVNQSDISSWLGMSHEITSYNDSHPGERALWTNSMFGGMPATTISVIYKGDITKYIYDLLFIGKRPASYLIISMIGAFLLFLAFGINIYLAILGAIAVTFCSYNMQIIQVGHNTKMMAIAFAPWVLAAIVYAYKKGTLVSGLFFALALSFQIKANHPQITYYLAIIVFGYAIWKFIEAVKNKKIPGFAKTSAIILAAGIIGIALNMNHLLPTYEYSGHSMRGGSELSLNGRGDTPAPTGTVKRKGLDLKYATQWSYGIGESLNMLIPNLKGGASSGSLNENSATYKALKANGYRTGDIMGHLPLYWGPQPFTAGPMYMGAIIIFLFVLGFFVLKGGLKWWISATGLLVLFLAWGYHMMPVSEFFFKYAPLYNKFRTVSMILVSLQFLLPIMAVLTADKLLCKAPSADKKKTTSGFGWAIGITAGICLLMVLFPSIAGNFTSDGDAGLPGAIASALSEDRIALLRSDAFRSMIFILLAAGTLWLGYIKKITGSNAAIILSALVLIDMWTIDKRYLNDSHFVTKREFRKAVAERPADKMILKDGDPDYRVLDLSIDPFNNSYSSYYHKTIGGYSPAKLQRYQDIIDFCLTPEINSISNGLKNTRTLKGAEDSLPYEHVLSMLNTKYIIINGNYPPLRNKYAFGNAWFADKLIKAPDANHEMTNLLTCDPSKECVINEKFANDKYLGSFYDKKDIGTGDSEGSLIYLSSYSPNILKYKYDSRSPRIAVFSEVYYEPGWNAMLKTDDGKARKLNIFRADYILRGLALPAGKGEIEFSFEPKSFSTGETISKTASILIILWLLGCIAAGISGKRKRTAAIEA
ncbi:MAG: hypothetical protein LKI53_03640 [Bacteroidales bacterium]|jgi:hypothetical protein|nr:hypothetical protein [Bacteroidales bacterium]